MVAVEVTAKMAAVTAAARSDSGVEVGWGGVDDEVVKARTCEAVEVTARSVGGGGGGGGRSVGGDGCGGGGGGCGCRWSLAASIARCSSAPLQRS